MLKTRVNDIDLAYERRGRGRPLLLLHGYPLDHSIWDAVAPLLENDFDLILPDLRGFGKSETVRIPCRLTDMAADLAALLDVLGLEQAAVVGHSMGGYIALAFARAYPQRLWGLGLIASQAAADTPERKEARYALAERVEQNGVGEVADSMPGLLTSDPRLQARLRQLIRRQSPWGVSVALRAMAERSDSTAVLADLEIPLIVMHGLADRLIPIERAREAASTARRATLVELAGAEHMPMLETPQDTARALRHLLT
jgi:3-oxoadipate enol-lactonase